MNEPYLLGAAATRARASPTHIRHEASPDLYSVQTELALFLRILAPNPHLLQNYEPHQGRGYLLPKYASSMYTSCMNFSLCEYLLREQFNRSQGQVGSDETTSIVPRCNVDYYLDN
jgi:hypothetical protein